MRFHPFAVRRLALVAVLLAAPLAGPTWAADGDLDTTFRNGGTFAFSTPSLGGRALAFRSDGVPLVGYTAVLDGTDRDMRFLPVPDQGVTTYCGAFHPDLGGTDDDRLVDLEVLGNYAYVAGDAAGPAGSPYKHLAVARFNLSNCQLDATFGGSSGLIYDASYDHAVAGFAALGSGAVRVAGKLIGNAGTPYLTVRGFTAGGEFDNGFTFTSESFADAYGAISFEPSAMARQPDGKLVVVGTMTLANGDKDVGVARVLANGNLDTSFSLDGLIGFSYDIIDSGDDLGLAIGVLPDRRIVVGGSVERASGRQAAVAVLTETGGYSNDFGIVGRYAFDYAAANRLDAVRALAVQGNGRIVVAGEDGQGGLGDTQFGIARLLSTGGAPLDPSFSGDGRRVVDFDLGGLGWDGAQDVALDPQGRIVVSGYAQTADNFAVAVVRLENAYIFADGFEWGTTGSW
ncbi:MAG: hypothetical protein H6511_01180 [Holophagales bacterium]|nr:hypothetical protein [Holophagales bacterium]